MQGVLTLAAQLGRCPAERYYQSSEATMVNAADAQRTRARGLGRSLWKVVKRYSFKAHTVKLRLK
jgi:hypothetical protein